jgi:hypothetical protein
MSPLEGEKVFDLSMDGIQGSEPLRAVHMPDCGYAVVIGSDHMEKYGWVLDNREGGAIRTSNAGSAIMLNRYGKRRQPTVPTGRPVHAAMLRGRASGKRRRTGAAGDDEQGGDAAADSPPTEEFQGDPWEELKQGRGTRAAFEAAVGHIAESELRTVQMDRHAVRAALDEVTRLKSRAQEAVRQAELTKERAEQHAAGAKKALEDTGRMCRLEAQEIAQRREDRSRPEADVTGARAEGVREFMRRVRRTVAREASEVLALLDMVREEVGMAPSRGRRADLAMMEPRRGEGEDGGQADGSAPDDMSSESQTEQQDSGSSSGGADGRSETYDERRVRLILQEMEYMYQMAKHWRHELSVKNNENRRTMSRYAHHLSNDAELAKGAIERHVIDVSDFLRGVRTTVNTEAQEVREIIATIRRRFSTGLSDDEDDVDGDAVGVTEMSGLRRGELEQREAARGAAAKRWGQRDSQIAKALRIAEGALKTVRTALEAGNQTSCRTSLDGGCESEKPRRKDLAVSQAKRPEEPGDTRHFAGSPRSGTDKRRCSSVGRQETCSAEIPRRQRGPPENRMTSHHCGERSGCFRVGTPEGRNGLERGAMAASIPPNTKAGEGDRVLASISLRQGDARATGQGPCEDSKKEPCVNQGVHVRWKDMTEDRTPTAREAGELRDPAASSWHTDTSAWECTRPGALPAGDERRDTSARARARSVGASRSTSPQRDTGAGKNSVTRLASTEGSQQRRTAADGSDRSVHARDVDMTEDPGSQKRSGELTDTSSPMPSPGGKVSGRPGSIPRGRQPCGAVADLEEAQGVLEGMPTTRTETIEKLVDNRMAAEGLRELDRVVGEGTEWCEPRYCDDEDGDDDAWASGTECDAAASGPEGDGGGTAASGTGRTRVARDMKLAAWAETDVPVVLEGAAGEVGQVAALVHPDASNRRPWRVARMLVSSDDEGRAVVRVCNASQEPLSIAAGTTVGTWEDLGAGAEVISLEPEPGTSDEEKKSGCDGREYDGSDGAYCRNNQQMADQEWAEEAFLDEVMRSCECVRGKPCHATKAFERLLPLKDWHRRVQSQAFRATVEALRRGDEPCSVFSDPGARQQKGELYRLRFCECGLGQSCNGCESLERTGGLAGALSVAARRWRTEHAARQGKARSLGVRVASVETDGVTRGGSAARGDDAIHAEDKWVPTMEGAKEPGPHSLEELAAYLAKDSSHLTEGQRDEVLEILSRYPEVITNRMGQTPLVEHHIETGKARPIYGARFRKSPAEVEEIQRQVDSLLEKGVVRESDSPWAAPVVLARKSDGTWRFCVDYRRLNAVTQRDSYPLPRIDATLDRLGGSMYFTTMDLLSGFWQVPMRPEDRPKTAFCTTSGLYEWNCMPMGLINSPATFQRLMDRVLGKLRYTFALVYLDDIMVHSSTWEEHLKHLDAVFQCLKKAGLTVKLKKCHFGRIEVEYLGHVVGREGIKVDPKKVTAIAELRAPRNVSEVRTLLGMVAYYRRFIPDCSALSKPLHNLTRKDTPFVWSEACEASMAELKRLLVQAPALRPPDFTKPFRVRSDASYQGLGATLMQGDQANGDDWYVVAYASRSLTKAEKNYSATDLECRGVLFAVNQFRPYIYGRKFQMETDHKALIWLLGTKHSNGRLQRSVMELQTYDYELVHKAGITMQDADCLSRLTAIKAVCAQHADRPAAGTGRIAALEGVAELNATAASTDRLANPQARRMTRREIVDRVKAALYEEERWFEVRAMLQWKKNGARPRRRPKVEPWVRHHASDFELDSDGILFHTGATDALGVAQKRLVVPTDMRREVMYACHEHMVSGGHLGRDRTVQKIQQRYYWPGLVTDVERWVASCVPCLAAKTPARQYRLPISAVPVPAAPWDLVSVDVTGPFPGTDRKNVYVVVFCDHLTRWVEAFATPDMETSTIADLLIKHVICRHGAPRTLLSDQGSSFVSHLAAAVYHRLGVMKIQASTYHPQTNGLVERFNRTMKEMLQKYVDTRHTDWDVYVPYVIFAYNTSAHKALDGVTPFQMLYGRKPTLPVDAMLLPAETQGVLTGEEQTYYADLQHGLQLLHSHGRYSLQRQQRERIWRRRARGNVPSFKVGDVVWIKEGAAEVTPEDDTGLARKLMPRWKGPFVVTRVVGPLNYVVQGPGGYEKLVHVERVKIHKRDGRNPPPENDTSDSSDGDEAKVSDDESETEVLAPPGAAGEDKQADSDSTVSDGDTGGAPEWDDTAADMGEYSAVPPGESEGKAEEPDGLDTGGREAAVSPPAGSPVSGRPEGRRSGRTRRPPTRLGAGEAKEGAALGAVDRRQMSADKTRTAVRRRNQCRICGQLKAGHTCPGRYVPQPQSTARYARHAARPKAGPDPLRIVFGIRRRDGSATVVFKGKGRVTKNVDGHHLDPVREGGDTAWHDTCCMCGNGGAVVCCYSCNEVAHPGCLQRQDVATFADDEDYLCAQCAHSAWRRVLRARRQEPGATELEESPFSQDRPMAVVRNSAIRPQLTIEDGSCGNSGTVNYEFGDRRVNTHGDSIGGGDAVGVTAQIRIIVIALLLMTLQRVVQRDNLGLSDLLGALAKARRG